MIALIQRVSEARVEVGAEMRVHLVNDGPVTFWLRVAAQRAS